MQPPDVWQWLPVGQLLVGLCADQWSVVDCTMFNNVFTAATNDLNYLDCLNCYLVIYLPSTFVDAGSKPILYHHELIFPTSRLLSSLEQKVLTQSGMQPISGILRLIL